MKILYFDCFSGISGDMVIGALLDAGGDFEKMKVELKKMQVDEEYELERYKVDMNGINSTKFNVIIKNDHHHETHDKLDEHQHTHDHHHHHAHRTYKDIVHMIDSASFPERVKNIALEVFEKIGKAESKIHNVPLEKVHFHEVGAIDSIIDIVGAAILIHQLEIQSVHCSPVPLGTGNIQIDHGLYPVPAPATLEIMKGIPIQENSLKAELTTPTGAGIIAVLAEQFRASFPPMTVEKIGYGAGTKTFPDRPNVLRVVIGDI